MTTVVDVPVIGSPVWQELLANRPHTLFHSEPWAQTLADAYGFDVRGSVVLHQGVPVAGMPWCDVDDVSGRRRVALPFADVGGPVGADPVAWGALVDTIAASGVFTRFRTLDASLLADPRVVERGRAWWHRLDLAGGADATRAGYAPAARRGVARARTVGVTVDALADDEIDDFLRLHVGVRKHKYGLLAQPRGFFLALRERFRAVDGWYPLAARLDGAIVAVTVYLRWGDMLAYKFNASDPGALAARPNNLLVEAGVELGAALRCRTLDFGASDLDQPGLARFKEQFGARAATIITATIGAAPDDGAARRALALAQSALCASTVPDPVTRLAADLLYRYFA